MPNFFKPHLVVGAVAVSSAAICAVSSLCILQTVDNLSPEIKKEMKNNLLLSLFSGVTGFTVLFKDKAINLLRDYTGIDIQRYLDNVTGQDIHQHAKAFDMVGFRSR